MAVQAHFYPENPNFQDYWGVNLIPGIEFQPDSGFSLQNLHQTLFSPENRGISSAACSSSTGNSFPSMAIPQSLESQILMQNQELDFILQLQSERLRFAIQRLRNQELGILLKNMESKASILMKQKEDDLIQAKKTKSELESILRQTEAETESWKRLAISNEATAINLNNTLQQFLLGQDMVGTSAEDAESSCFSENPGMACKNCNLERKCVLFLPCRHLCSCKKCEVFLGCCPVCKCVKEASMEVFLG